MVWDAITTVAPYVGVYADYYFSTSNDAPLLLPTQFIQGWSARVAAGLALKLTGRANVTVGGELGGLGNNFSTWSVGGRVSLPFTYP
jgi:hypothetical protein